MKSEEKWSKLLFEVAVKLASRRGMWVSDVLDALVEHERLRERNPTRAMDSEPLISRAS